MCVMIPPIFWANTNETGTRVKSAGRDMPARLRRNVLTAYPPAYAGLKIGFHTAEQVWTYKNSASYFGCAVCFRSYEV